MDIKGLHVRCGTFQAYKNRRPPYSPTLHHQNFPSQVFHTITMSPAAINPAELPAPTNGAAPTTPTNSHAQEGELGDTPAFLSTEPGPDYDWKITLRGKVIAITGANRGIGLGLATVCLANDVAEIYSLDLFEPGEEFQALVKAHPKKVHYLHCDVTSEESVIKAVDTIVERSSRIDGMVCSSALLLKCVC
jgi:hypothetical protein